MEQIEKECERERERVHPINSHNDRPQSPQSVRPRLVLFFFFPSGKHNSPLNGRVFLDVQLHFLTLQSIWPSFRLRLFGVRKNAVSKNPLQLRAETDAISCQNPFFDSDSRVSCVLPCQVILLCHLPEGRFSTLLVQEEGWWCRVSRRAQLHWRCEL